MKTRPKRTSSSVWTLKEKKKLIAALQKYGFADFAKLADVVGTKNQSAINQFIVNRTHDLAKEARKTKDSDEQMNGTPKSSSQKPSSAVQCWKKIASNQHLYKRKTEDYSMVMCDLLKEFYEAEPETNDLGMVNLKAIYKYLLDCSSGTVPAVLKPLESAVILLLFRDLRHILATYDFKEANEFITNFRTATRFVPADIKQEVSKENGIKVPSSCTNNQTETDKDAVPIPNELFEDLSKHIKLKDDLNPLGIPLWLIARNQEMIDHFYSTK